VPESPDLLVTEAVLGRLLRLPSRPWEIGGWLLGYWSEDRMALVVTHATPPAARGTPFAVTISGKGHRQRFDQAWHATDGVVTFVGDWHTHPGGPAIPSSTDAKAARQLATDPDYGTQRPLLAIVANPRWPRSPQHRHVRFWLGNDDALLELAAVPLAQRPTGARFDDEWEWPSIGQPEHDTTTSPGRRHSP
jgi:integrative and conjugative element protein (TIGR02256 family)